MEDLDREIVPDRIAVLEHGHGGAGGRGYEIDQTDEGEQCISVSDPPGWEVAIRRGNGVGSSVDGEAECHRPFRNEVGPVSGIASDLVGQSVDGEERRTRDVPVDLLRVQSE